MGKSKDFFDDTPFDSGLDCPQEEDEVDIVDYVDPGIEDKMNNNYNNSINMNWSTPTYQSPWTGPTQQTTTPSSSPFSSGFNSNNNSSTPFYQQRPTVTNNSNNKLLPRDKKIVICDFLDNIVENWQSCPGIEPRDFYDLKPKFDFWFKMKYINPDYIIVCTNQNITPGTEDAKLFQYTTNYFLSGLARFIGMTVENCICLCKSGFDKRDFRVKPNPGLALDGLKMIHWKEMGYTKKDIVVVGYNSGNPGQSSKDLEMARKLGLDYIDASQLVESYV